MMTKFAWPKRLSLFGGLLLCCFLFQGVAATEVNAEYQAGRLIDDGLFLDSRSMSAADIQTFLTNKGSGLANMQFTLSCYGPESTERQWYTAAGAPCDTTIPASHIIYYAAQVYGISPKVILVTMQKEQSLTTAPNPTSWQLSQAMGYACPTSGSCNSSSNFSYQIDSGTWVLRYHFERARGNMTWWHQSSSWTCGTAKPSYYTPNLYPRQNVNFVDPYSGVQYATIYIHNAATSAFYCYTPHVFNNHTNSPHPQEPKGSSRCYASHPLAGDRGRCYTGSYNFVKFYELWFGSTNGVLVRSVDSSALYYYDGQRKYSVPSMQIINEYGLSLDDVRFLGQSEINAIPIGQGSFSNNIGQIIKTPDDSDTDGGSLYLVSGGRRIPIASMSQFSSMGLDSGDIRYVSLTVVDNLRLSSEPLSDFFQAPDKSVYKIEGSKLRAIFELPKLAAINPSGKITALTDNTLGMWAYGKPIVDSDYIVINPAGAIRVYNDASYFSVPSMGVFDCWKLDGVKTFRVWSFSVTNGTANGQLTCFGKDSLNNNYIMSKDKKYPLPPNTSLPVSLASDSLINRIPVGTLKSVVKGSGSGLSTLESDRQRPIPNMNIFSELGYTSNDILVINDAAISAIPYGPKKLAIGTLILESNGAVAVISSTGARLQIASPSQFNHFGYNWSLLLRVSDTDKNAYPSAGNLQYYFRIGSKAMLMDGGVRYIIPDENLSHYGASLESLPLVDVALVDHAPTWTLSRFIKSSDSPAVYYVENGTRRPIASWQRVVELGGQNSITILSKFRAQSLPLGSNI